MLALPRKDFAVKTLLLWSTAAVLAFAPAAWAQDASQTPEAAAPNAPSGVSPIEQSATPGQAPVAPATNADGSAASVTPQTMQSEAPAQQSEALPPACAPATPLAGSEQSMSATDMSGMEQMPEGNDQLLSALSAVEVQMKSAVAQQNFDIAYACALVSLSNGVEAINKLNQQFGKDDKLKSAAEQTMHAGDTNIAGVVDWLNTQQASGSAPQ